MKKLFIAAAVLEAIHSQQDKIRTSCTLSTLKEGEDLTTIYVDNTLYTDELVISLSSEITLDDEDGKLVCSGIDQNTENTLVHISVIGGHTAEFEFDGDTYDSFELVLNHSFHEAVLNSPLSSLTMETVNNRLRQILPEYAVSAS